MCNMKRDKVKPKSWVRKNSTARRITKKELSTLDQFEAIEQEILNLITPHAHLLDIHIDKTHKEGTLGNLKNVLNRYRVYLRTMIEDEQKMGDVYDTHLKALHISLRAFFHTQRCEEGDREFLEQLIQGTSDSLVKSYRDLDYVEIIDEVSKKFKKVYGL